MRQPKPKPSPEEIERGRSRLYPPLWIPSRATDEEVLEFKEIYERTSGRTISQDDAREMVRRLFIVYGILLQRLPSTARSIEKHEKKLAKRSKKALQRRRR
jgi:hypothetical protein